MMKIHNDQIFKKKNSLWAKAILNGSTHSNLKVYTISECNLLFVVSIPLNTPYTIRAKTRGSSYIFHEKCIRFIIFYFNLCFAISISLSPKPFILICDVAFSPPSLKCKKLRQNKIINFMHVSCSAFSCDDICFVSFALQFLVLSLNEIETKITSFAIIFNCKTLLSPSKWRSTGLHFNLSLTWVDKNAVKATTYTSYAEFIQNVNCFE